MDNLYKKVLIVGAGLAGSTIARILAENSIKVFVIEKRNHVAGNIYDYENENNERIHKYGPHLLHCSRNSESLKFLSRFTDWVKYEHRVRALLSSGSTTPLPINKTTIENFFNKKFKNEFEVREFLNLKRNKNLTPNNSDELFEYSVGNEMADIFFRPYTRKMWGIDPKQLEISIGARLPVRTNEDDRYFNDNFQALPKNGYTKMIQNMLDHDNINLKLNTDYEKGMELDYLHAFLCTPIDEYYDYKYGVLPYRSIIFHEKKETTENFSAPVINFTDDSCFTRKTQWNLFPNSYGKINKVKTVTYEMPCSLEENPGEHYYPVQTKDSRLIYQKYQDLSKKQKKITFCGRTGLFKYIDMIPAVGIHIKMANKFLNQSL